MKDSYSHFLERFNIKENDFLEYGKESIIYVSKDIAKKEWENLKYRITHNKEVYIRSYGNNGKNSKIFIDFIKYVFKNDQIKIDLSSNSKPQNCLKKYTKLERGKDIQNYQVSHIFGMTKNPYMFECPWNIAYIPKIFDPFTGHESRGEWTQKFQDYYLKDVQENFQEFIEDYNNIIKKYNITEKVDSFIESISGYTNKQKDKFKNDLLDNFKMISFTVKGSKVKASTLNMKIGQFVYSLMEEIEKSNTVINSEMIEYLIEPSKSHEYFKTNISVPVLKEYNEDDRNNKQHYVGEYQRYISPRNKVFVLNGKKYMITKELYEHQRQAFIDWRNKLN